MSGENKPSLSVRRLTFNLRSFYVLYNVQRAHSSTRTQTHTPPSDNGRVGEGVSDRDCRGIQANMIDFMITLSPQLVFMLSRHAKSFQRDKWHKKGELRGGRQPATAFTLKPTSSPDTRSPHGTFNGMKLWPCKSDNNCLGLKHNTLTGLTRPFSPPPLAPRRGHLL